MVKCKECEKDMLDNKTTSCTHQLMVMAGKLWLRDTTYFDVNKRCHDCGIVNKAGNVHHWGCDMERCPKCGKQLISCGCADKGVYLYKIENNARRNKLK